MVQCSGPGLVNNEGGRARQHHAALRALTISIIITITVVIIITITIVIIITIIIVK